MFLAETTMTAFNNPLLWVGFIVFVLVMMVIDLGLFSRRAHTITTREAVGWTIVWISMALIFNAGILYFYGKKPAEEFLAGYLLEKSLSVDNLFVFVLVFSYFRTPQEQLHRVLVWGIIGAMVLRAAMIMAGVALIHRFEIVLLFMGAFLIYSGAKLLFHDDDADIADSRLVRTFQRVLPLTKDYHGSRFFVRHEGKLMATPLFLVLLVIEVSDVVFAVDSIPAIFGVTQDAFVVFTSNIFAILGLRALFFVIQTLLQKLQYLNYGLCLVLCFVGVKMILPFVPRGLHWAGVDIDPQAHWHIETEWSLLFIVGTLATTAAISVWKASGAGDDGDEADGQAASEATEAPAGTTTEDPTTEPAPSASGDDNS